MTAQAFADVLKEPESDVSHARLHQLVSAHDFSGPTLPIVAEDCLRAFCDRHVSVIRRRWAGVALVQMLQTCANTVEHLRQSSTALHGLGEVILSATEWEETKVIAGLIIKQGIEQGIDFSKFWASDKVKNSALNFPRQNNRDWMEQFQAFLDTLSDLALMDPKADPCILYPISLFGSDGLKWMDWDKGAPIAILQNEFLTIITPTQTFLETIFVDIPFSHIHSARVQRSNLQSSQTQMIHHEPWEIVLVLNHCPWTYHYNSSERKGTEVKLTFQNELDAKECQNAINESRKSNDVGPVQPRQTHAMMSRSSPIYVGRRSPMQTSQTTKAKEYSSAPTAYEPVRNEGIQRPPSDDSVVKTSRSRFPHESSAAKSLENMKGCLSDVHGEALQPHPSGSSTVHDDTLQPGWQQNASRSGQQSITASLANMSAAQHQTKQQQSTTHLSQKDVSDLDKVNSPRDTRWQSGKEQSQPISMQRHDPAATNDAINEVGSPKRAESIRPTPKRVTYGQGKLPSVSQAMKERVMKHIPAETRASAVARNRKSSNAKSMKEASTDDDSDEVSTYDLPSSVKHQPQSKRISNATTGTSRGRKAQNRCLPDPDDEYVPEKPLSESNSKKKNASAKRKGAPDVHTNNKRPKTRANPKAKSDVSGITTTKSSEKRDANDEHGEQAGSISRNKQEEMSITKREPYPRQLKNKSKLHSSKRTHTQQNHSSTAPKRHSLIEGLLQSANPTGVSSVVFKKPTTPFQASQSPSTPIQTRSQSIICRPETPIESRERRSGAAPPITSSPSVWNLSQERSGRLRRFAVDTEILSSNSKRVPDSPHAESTAISGHADHDDIDNEKREGDTQTAKSNPFCQRRVDGKASSFIRRLTGEDRAEDNQALEEELLHVLPMNLNESDVSDMEDAVLKPASQPLPRPRTSQKILSPAGVEQPAQRRFGLFSGLNEPAFSAKEKQNETHQSLQRLQDSTTRIPESSNLNVITTQRQVDTKSNIIFNDTTTQISVEAYGTNSAVTRESEPNGEMCDSILPTPAQFIEDTQMQDQDQNGAQHQDQDQPQNNDVDMDGNITLVNDANEEELPELLSKPFLARFRSSPSEPGSSSSHSSTSAEPEPSSDPPIPTSQAEEMEWEASLEPHQRALHDLLIRASKRVLRHIVDNETAVADVAEIFARDGHHLLNQLLERQESTYSQVFEDMNKKRNNLTVELEGVTKRLAKERRRIKAVV